MRQEDLIADEIYNYKGGGNVHLVKYITIAGDIVYVKGRLGSKFYDKNSHRLCSISIFLASCKLATPEEKHERHLQKIEFLESELKALTTEVEE